MKRCSLRSIGLAFLLGMGSILALAQTPVSQGWGVGVDASRVLGGHAVFQLEHAQSPMWVWKVGGGTFVGTPSGQSPAWKGLKGQVVSGSLVSIGTLMFPEQEPKLGATWFLGADLTRESYRIQKRTDESVIPVLQTREEARLVAGAQWSMGRHATVRAHVGMGVVKDRLSQRFVGEEINSLPMARPAGLALIWRW